MLVVIKYEKSENENRISTQGELDSIQFVYELSVCNLANVNTELIFRTMVQVKS
jgi:hypothetical protein